MRILWFSPTSACYSCKENASKYNGGGWLESLQHEILKQNDMSLGISFCMNGQPHKSTQHGITYYPISHHTKNTKEKILDILNYKDVKRDEIIWPYYIDKFKEIITDFKPDIIEVFGSELYIGLATIAAKEMNIPCCLHVQGILSLYIYSFMPPGVSKLNYYFCGGLKNIFSKFQYITYWRRSCHREKHILKNVPHVLGRTEWDKQAMDILAPQAAYHYCGEILRETYYQEKERHIPEKLTIVTTISNSSYKGFDLILKIANILKNIIKLDFTWKVFGNIDTHLAENITGINHKDVNVHLCGVANAEQIRETLLNCTLYCHPSYIENSSNSIGEAQILGVPVVATNVGGTSSMIQHGITGLLFPATEPYSALYYILQIYHSKNNDLANNAKKLALKRHNRKDIVTNLLQIYKDIIYNK